MSEETRVEGMTTLTLPEEVVAHIVTMLATETLTLIGQLDAAQTRDAELEDLLDKIPAPRMKARIEKSREAKGERHGN